MHLITQGNYRGDMRNSYTLLVEYSGLVRNKQTRSGASYYKELKNAHSHYSNHNHIFYNTIYNKLQTKAYSRV